jgi:hypothetical protein
MTRTRRLPSLRILLPLLAAILATEALVPAATPALTMSAPRDVLGRADVRVSLAATDPAGLAILLLDGAAVRTAALVGSRTTTFAAVPMAPGPHRITVLLRSRAGVLMTPGADVRCWTRPASPSLIDTPACGLVGTSARLTVRGDAAATRITIRVNGGPSTTLAATRGAPVTIAPVLPAPGANTVRLTASNPVASSTATLRLRRLECWPAPGLTTVTSPFGWRVHPITGVWKLHAGTDIGGAYGTPLVAASAGIVTMAGPNGGYGNCVVVDHGDGITTLYGHQSVIAVSRGDRVPAGRRIGAVGSTGLSTGPHLHVEVRLDGTPTDPMAYLPRTSP